MRRGMPVFDDEREVIHHVEVQLIRILTDLGGCTRQPEQNSVMTADQLGWVVRAFNDLAFLSVLFQKLLDLKSGERIATKYESLVKGWGSPLFSETGKNRRF